ncbi:hypothetical protein ACQ2H7_001672 [Candidozyma auris]
MSIISLESPRNSIVSIDDNYIRPTRNNSTASLSSMGPATAAASPSETPKENYVISNRHKMRSKNTTSSAIVSDEDSESELYMVHGKMKWRRNSNEKAQRVSSLSSVKKDFKFRFEKKKAAGQSASLSPNSVSNTLNSDTKFPSPSSQYSRKPNHIIGDEPISPQSSLNPLRALRSPSPPPHGFPSSEVSSIRSQNKLITELNRKWNKATMEMTEKRLDLKDPATASPSKKRDRSESVSSTDSYAIH